MKFDLERARAIAIEMAIAVPGVTITGARTIEPPPIPPAVLAAIGSSPSSPPGLSIPNYQDIAIKVEGWGPTFHRREMTWEFGLGGSYADMEIILRTNMRMRLEDQQSIADAAKRHGVDAPLSTPDRVRADDIRHLSVPLATIDALIHDHGARGAVEIIANHLERVLSTPSNNDLGIVLGDCVAHFEDDLAAFHPHVHLRHQRLFEMRGCHVGIKAIIPETLLVTAPGRPLGAYIETGIPALDAVPIIMATRSGPDSTLIQIKTPHMRVDAHPALAAELPSIL